MLLTCTCRRCQSGGLRFILSSSKPFPLLGPMCNTSLPTCVTVTTCLATQRNMCASAPVAHSALHKRHNKCIHATPIHVGVKLLPHPVSLSSAVPLIYALKHFFPHPSSADALLILTTFSRVLTAEIAEYPILETNENITTKHVKMCTSAHPISCLSSRTCLNLCWASSLGPYI